MSGKRLKKSSKLLKLCPYLDDNGLLRSKSRLQCVSWLSDEIKFPIILPKHHPTTRLLVTEVHENLQHPLGLNAALTELSKKYWVIGARVLMKKVKLNCIKCKIQNAKPVQPVWVLSRVLGSLSLYSHCRYRLCPTVLDETG